MADAISVELVTVQAEGLTLSRLIWRRFNARKDGYIEKVLAANPGIAEHPYLPVGRTVALPIGDDVEKPERAEAVRLWN